MPTFRALGLRAASWAQAALAAPGRHPGLLLLLFLIALGPRWSLAMEEHQPGLYLMSDMAIYRERALRLLDGPTDVWDTFTPVGYPALVALVFGALGRDDALIGALQAALGAATAVLAFLLALRVSGRAVTALVAFGAVAFYLPLLFYTGLFLTETTFAFLLTLFVVLFTAAVDRGRAPIAAGAGLVLAAAAAVRPNLLLFFPFLAALAVAFRKERRFARAAVVTALAALPLLALVSARNSRLAGRFATLGTNGGVNFYLAHADLRALRFPPGDAIREISAYQNRARFTAVEETAHHAHDEAYFYAAGLAELRREPRKLLRSGLLVADGLGLGRLAGRENPPYWPGWNGHDDALGVWARAMFALGIAPAVLHAAWLAWRRRLFTAPQAPRLLVLSILGSVLVTLAVFLGNPRVRVSIDPLLLALAADAWVALAVAARAALRAHRP